MRLSNHAKMKKWLAGEDLIQSASRKTWSKEEDTTVKQSRSSLPSGSLSLGKSKVRPPIPVRILRV